MTLKTVGRLCPFCPMKPISWQKIYHLPNSTRSRLPRSWRAAMHHVQLPETQKQVVGETKVNDGIFLALLVCCINTQRFYLEVWGAFLLPPSQIATAQAVVFVRILHVLNSEQGFNLLQRVNAILLEVAAGNVTSKLASAHAKTRWAFSIAICVHYLRRGRL